MKIKKKLNTLLLNHIDESLIKFNETKKNLDKVYKIANFFIKKIDSGNKIFVYGNGGSLADSMHFVGELVSTYKKKKKKSLHFINLYTNIATLTAWSNDFNYKNYIARELSGTAISGDVLVLISTSGGNVAKKQSLNLIEAAKFAKIKKIDLVSFLGSKGGALKKYSKISYIVRSNNTPVIQENHKLIFHLISEILDQYY